MPRSPPATGLFRPSGFPRLTQTLTALGYLALCAPARSLIRWVRRAPRFVILRCCRACRTGSRLTLSCARSPRRRACRCRWGPRAVAMINIDTVPPRATRRRARFDLGARIPLAPTAMGRAYLLPSRVRSVAGCSDRIRRDAGREWRTIRSGYRHCLRDASNAAASSVFPPASGGADVVGVGAPVVTADGVVLAVNCGRPPFEISEEAGGWRMWGPRVAHAAASIAGSSDLNGARCAAPQKEGG